MKRNFYSVFIFFVFIIFNITTTLAQLSQLAKAKNFSKNFIPIEIQNGFVLDSVSSTGFSPFNTFHFKYNSSGQLIREDDQGVLTLTNIDSTHGRPRTVNVSYQLFSDNSYNEKGLLTLQNVYYVDSVLRDYGSEIYSYDSNNRIKSVVRTTPIGDTTRSNSFQYDLSGNLTGYYLDLYPFGSQLSSVSQSSSIMNYDSLERLIFRSDSPDDGLPEYFIEYFYKYDSIGNVSCTRVDSMYRQNYPPLIDAIEIHRLKYDGSGRELLDIWSGTVDSLFNEKVVFTYDGSGKIFSIIDSSYSYDQTLYGRSPYIFSYNSDNNLDSCVTGWSGGFGDFKPGGILLYDHYGNAVFKSFESGVTGFKIFPYYSKLSTLGVTKSQGMPSDFYISQNYPNPFNPSTVISYSLAKAGNVTLKVYNMLGQEVATLVNGYQNANTYKVSFNASGLSSGVYIYELRSGSNVASGKMLLMK